MPQIAQLAETYSSQLFWLLVTFGLVFFVIGLGMLPKIQSTIAARDSKIADDLAKAKAAFGRGDELEEDYRVRENEARVAAQKIVADAKASGTKDTEKVLAKADRGIADKVDAAEKAIGEARGKALAEIESVSVEAALDMVARLSGARSDPEMAAQAVKAALGHG